MSGIHLSHWILLKLDLTVIRTGSSHGPKLVRDHLIRYRENMVSGAKKALFRLKANKDDVELVLKYIRFWLCSDE